MTIQSMTAFARAQHQGEWGSVVCEIRSINHRYLELIVRLPDTLHELEAPMREYVRNHVKRGKIECQYSLSTGDSAGTGFTINTHLATQLCKANQTIAEVLRNPAAVNTMDILRWPGVLQIAELDLEDIEDKILEVLEKGLVDLIEARGREGVEFEELFLQRLEGMIEELAKVRHRLPGI